MSLIRERRETSKEDRLDQFRDDTVDEVDTTDLENWALRRRETIGEEDSEDFIHFKNIDGLETQNEKEDMIRRHPWQHRYAIEMGLSVT